MIQRTFRLAAAAAWAALSTTGLSAQQPIDDVARFFEAVEVRRLELDVVVVDRDGEPVDGLSAADFEILADGSPVEIAGFDTHQEVGVATEAPAAAGATTTSAPSARPSEPITWLVHVDQSRLRASRRNAILRQVGEFLDGGLRPGDRTMVAHWDGDALRVVGRLSADRQGALDALDQIASTAARSSPLEGAAASIRTEINNAAPLSINIAPDKAERMRRDDLPTDELRPGTRVAAENLLRQIDALSDLEIARARAALGGLRDLIALSAGVDGRVGLLLVGGGYDSNVADGLYRMWESRFSSLDQVARAGVLGSRAHEVQEELNRLLASLANGSVTIFTIGATEPEGLDAIDTSGAGTALRGGSAATDTGAEAAMTLAGLADATGGRTFGAGTRLAEQLGAARRHLTTYYTLGVDPGEHASAPRLEVRVRRDGLRALHRLRAPRLASDDLAAADAISALLESGSVASPGLAIEPGPPVATDREPARAVPVTIRVPLADLTLAPDGEVHRGSLAYHLAVERPDGAFVRLEPRALEFEVANAELAGALGRSIGFRLDVAFGEGEHWLGVAVLDRASGRRWSGAIPIDVDRAQ
jgi:VWFA-related protein